MESDVGVAGFSACFYLNGRVIFAARPVVSCAADKEVQSVNEGGYVVVNRYQPTSQALYGVINGVGTNGYVEPIGGIRKSDSTHMGEIAVRRISP